MMTNFLFCFLLGVTPKENSMSLAIALREANERNLTLAIAKMELEKAEAQLHQTWGILLPFVNGQISYTHNDHADTFNIANNMAGLFQALGMPSPNVPDAVVRPQEDARALLLAGMPIVNVQAWLTVHAARLGVELAAVNAENAKEQLLYGVAQAFFAAVVAKEMVDIQTEQVTATAKHLEVARAKLQAGDSLKIDVIRAETELEKSKQELIGAELAYENARDALASLTGVQYLPIPVAPEALPDIENVEALNIDDLVLKRPDTRAILTMKTLNQRMLTTSWMQFIPTLNVSGQFSYLFSEPPDLGSQDRTRWATMLTLSVPLYNEGRYADLQMKRVALRQATLRSEDVLQQATLEVRKARRDYTSTLATVDTAQRQVELTQRALELAEAAYAQGAMTSLDVTDAQRMYRTAQMNAAAQRLRSQMLLLTLMKATGHKASDLIGQEMN